MIKDIAIAVAFLLCSLTIVFASVVVGMHGGKEITCQKLYDAGELNAVKLICKGVAVEVVR